MFARIRAGAMVNLLIQSAINSAESLGFGFAELREQKLFWVLSRLTVEIYHPLKWNEEAEVETWPKSVEGLLYTRDYIVRDKDAEYYCPGHFRVAGYRYRNKKAEATGWNKSGNVCSPEKKTRFE